MKAYQDLWAKVKSARDDLQTELLEGDIVWDEQIHTKFNPLFRLQSELSADIQSHLAVADPQATCSEREGWDAVRAGRRSVMYDMLSHGDIPFSDEMKTANYDIESYLKPHLKK